VIAWFVSVFDAFFDFSAIVRRVRSLRERLMLILDRLPSFERCWRLIDGFLLKFGKIETAALNFPRLAINHLIGKYHLS
jgi:hypothetical protein